MTSRFSDGWLNHHRGPIRLDLPHLRLKAHHLRLHEGPPKERAHFLEAKSSSKHHFAGNNVTFRGVNPFQRICGKNHPPTILPLLAVAKVWTTEDLGLLGMGRGGPVLRGWCVLGSMKIHVKQFLLSFWAMRKRTTIV